MHTIICKHLNVLKGLFPPSLSLSLSLVRAHTHVRALTLEGLLILLTDLITWVDGASTPRWRRQKKEKKNLPFLLGMGDTISSGYLPASRSMTVHRTCSHVTLHT